MPVTAETLRLVDSTRARVDAGIDDVTRQLVAVWANSWDRLYGVWYAAVADLQGTGAGWPGRNTVYRATQGAASTTGEELRRLLAIVPQIVTPKASDAASAAVLAQADVVRSQLPPTGALPPAAAVLVAAALVNPVAPAVVAGIVAAAAAQVVKDLAHIPTGTVRLIQRTVAQGPHAGARDSTARTQSVLQRLERVYNRGLTTSLASARSAVADAARNAIQRAQQHPSQRALLAGWRWMSKLSATTCSTCFGLHGREFPLSTPGPRDHPNGACWRLSFVKPWRVLGIDVPEPADVPNEAETRFNALPVEDQARIMGRRRLAAYKAGDITWADLVVRRPTRRISYKTRPLAA